MEFGQIVPLKLSDLWKNEAMDFTPWLTEHLDLLSDKIGMELAFEDREASAGDFSVDILARDMGTDNFVIIENQFGMTNHQHLGQIITYAAMLDARVVVWIAETFRNEHKAAIDLLNQSFKERLQFFAIEPKILKIDDSRPAFDLNVICQPPPTEIIIGTSNNERKEQYREFFQGVMDELRQKHNFTKARVAQPQNWYNFASEMSQVYKYGLSFANRNRVRVEIYIDMGNLDRNKCVFDRIEQQKNEIESAFGEILSWERLPERRACRIALYREGSIDDDLEILSEVKDWAIEQLLKFKQILPKYMNAAVDAASQEVPPSL